MQWRVRGPQVPCDIRDAWMAGDHAWHGLPARPGKAARSDVLGNSAAAREVAKVPVKRAVWGIAPEATARNVRGSARCSSKTAGPGIRFGTGGCGHSGRVDGPMRPTGLWPTRVPAPSRFGRDGPGSACRTWRAANASTFRSRAHTCLPVPCASSRGTAAGWRSTRPWTKARPASTQACGPETLGVDKGCTEACTDSDGERHGEDPGDLLSAESDQVKAKGRKRNLLRAPEARHRKPGARHKADNIRHNNLGHRKWDRRRQQPYARVRGHLCQAAHSIVDPHHRLRGSGTPHEVRQGGPRNIQRRLRGWTQGLMADTQTSISRCRGSALVSVNPACTSPIDSRTGLLQGTRRGDRCCGLDGVVLDADTKAARNILARLYDDGITLYTPPRESQTPAPGSNWDTGGDCPPRTRARRTARPGSSRIVTVDQQVRFHNPSRTGNLDIVSVTIPALCQSAQE